MVVGLTVVFFTHENPNAEDILLDKSIVNVQKYTEHVEPWIRLASYDQSLQSISSIKENFLKLKGSDQSMGPAHLSLFLAFDAWERFLLNNKVEDQQASINHFSKAAELLPDLAAQIEELKSILSEQDA